MTYQEIQNEMAKERKIANEAHAALMAEIALEDQFANASNEAWIAHCERLEKHAAERSMAWRRRYQLQRREQVLILGKESANDLQSDA